MAWVPCGAADLRHLAALSASQTDRSQMSEATMWQCFFSGDAPNSRPAAPMKFHAILGRDKGTDRIACTMQA